MAGFRRGQIHADQRGRLDLSCLDGAEFAPRRRPGWAAPDFDPTPQWLADRERLERLRRGARRMKRPAPDG